MPWYPSALRLTVERGFMHRRLNVGVPQTPNCRRWLFLSLTLILAAACSVIPATDSNTTPEPTTSIAPATSSAPVTTTTTDAEGDVPASTTTIPVESVECGDDHG